MKNKGKRTLAIWALVIALCSLTVAYAVLQTTLSISGTALRKAASWNVKISNIEHVSGVAPSIPTVSGTSLIFNVTLSKPGDYSVIKVTLSNNGTLSAVSDYEHSVFLQVGNSVINGLPTGQAMEPATSNGISCIYSSNSNIDFSNEIHEGLFTYLDASDSLSFYLKCKYDDVLSASDLSAQDVNVSVYFSVEYEQGVN